MEKTIEVFVYDALQCTRSDFLETGLLHSVYVKSSEVLPDICQTEFFLQDRITPDRRQS